MPSSNNNKKRNIEVVDLTQDENSDPHASKHAKTQKATRDAPLPTPPSSQWSVGDRNSWSQPTTSSQQHQEATSRSTQDEADDEVTSANDFDDNAYQRLCLYGILDHRIVGVRYYDGRATTGEFVLIKREPSNPYDGNAIRIDNVMGRQIGHIPKNMAAKLAPFLDSKELFVEGILTGPKGEFDMPLQLKLFGTTDPQQRAALKEKMKQQRLSTKELSEQEREWARQHKERAQRLAQEKQRKKVQDAANAAKKASALSSQQAPDEDDQNSETLGYANLGPRNGEGTPEPEVSMEDIINSSVSFDPRALGEVVDKYGSSEEQLSQLPLAEPPSELLTKLLPYQLQGLAWMLDRESPCLPQKGSKDSVQLWKPTTHGYTNIATNFTSKNPSLASGGILADDMGLGKTIEVISLLLADPHRTKQPTLIVSPLSVMSNWSNQILTHVKGERGLRVFIYHGGNKKSQKPSDFEKFDVVITTYETMALEYLPAGSKGEPQEVPRANGLFSVRWRRVVLDEGHAIRNPKSKKACAAYALASLSKSKWVLTGTPIVNNLKDLQSHVRFIGLSGGLDQPDVFSATVIRPLNQGRPEASVLLRALINTLCLRRMKDMKFIDLRLPTLSSHKYTVNWLPHERKKYEAFQMEAKGLLEKVQTHGEKKGENAFSHLLEVLLRLRQTCNHWKLCEERIKKLMANLEEGKTVKLNSENEKALQSLLQLSIDSQEECAVCLCTLHNPVITTCSHVFGQECIERVIETQHKCPLCRAELPDTNVLVKPAVELGENGSDSEIDIETSSSKVTALMDILKASRKKKDVKTVLFSQWTSFLDILEHQLKENGFKYARLDGKMNATQRDQAMDALANDPECTIMLASLAVCSVGLNLCAANQVILSDSWWSPMIEDQAVDRVYRLGQTKPVNVFRLVMEDSIEDRVIEIQQEKRKLMMTAFGEKTMKRGNEKTARLADIERLLK